MGRYHGPHCFVFKAFALSRFHFFFPTATSGAFSRRRFRSFDLNNSAWIFHRISKLALGFSIGVLISIFADFAAVDEPVGERAGNGRAGAWLHGRVGELVDRRSVKRASERALAGRQADGPPRVGGGKRVCKWRGGRVLVGRWVRGC